MILFDGDWMDSVPAQKRSRCIVLLTHGNAPHMARRVREGFKAAIVKEELVFSKWPTDLKAIVPPYIGPRPPRTWGTGGIAGLIRELDRHSPDAVRWAREAQVPIHGSTAPDVNDHELLTTLRWLWHVKELGYICNAVVKALTHGVPILTDQRTIDAGGYGDMLKDGVNCYVRNKPLSLLEAAKSSTPLEWECLSLNAYEQGRTYCEIQKDCLPALQALLERVAI